MRTAPALPLPLPLALVFVACQDPVGEPAIEITGYLDGTGVVFAVGDDRVSALGRQGAASAGSDVRLEAPATGGVDVRTVRDDGSFVLGLPGAPGDVLRLSVVGADAGETVVYDVADPPAFPITEAITVQPDPSAVGAVAIEVTLASARTDGRVWAAVQETGSVVVLEVHNSGRLHLGTAEGGSGDTVLLGWVPDDGTTSQVVTVPVP